MDGKIESAAMALAIAWPRASSGLRRPPEHLSGGLLAGYSMHLPSFSNGLVLTFAGVRTVSAVFCPVLAISL